MESHDMPLRQYVVDLSSGKKPKKRASKRAKPSTTAVKREGTAKTSAKKATKPKVVEDASDDTSEGDDDEEAEAIERFANKRKLEPDIDPSSLPRVRCRMDGCLAMARYGSKYCSDECGLVVARQLLLRREDEQLEAEALLLKNQVDAIRQQEALFDSDIDDFEQLDALTRTLEVWYRVSSIADAWWT
jgi:hypothetical protein